MYASVISVSIKPERFDEFLSIYANGAMSAIRAARGFGGGLVLSDRVKNAAFVVTLWASEAGLEHNEKRCRIAPDSASGFCLSHAPRSERCELLVQAGQKTGGLYARVITLPVPEENVNSASRVYADEYLPLLKAQPGFVRVMWLADRVRGKGWGMSFWSSHEQMRAADAQGEFFSIVLARLAVYFSAPPEVGYYAVDVQV